MMRLPLLLCAFTPLVFSPISLAQDADPIRQAVEKARQTRDGKIETARKKLAKAIEAKLAELAKKGDLAGTKKLKAAKEAYQSDGSLPGDVVLAPAKRDFLDTVWAAELDYRKALQTAKTEYTKAQKIEAAEAIDEELQAITPKGVPPKPKEKPKPDAINGQWRISIGDRKFESDKIKSVNLRIDPGGVASLPGFLWRKQGDNTYTLIFPNGATGRVRLSPNGEQFRGKMTSGATIQGIRKV